ncbi:hypothetical protein NDN08_007164 [Rhodosorus marinus]|uniref:Uncharacterized protein n=1 Tax=Rhodosorus marinus TaxID=101924 RepID=A0AAV8UL12_9RHOD|nr:hypothetical protein NDN08_007164 [Rhodosorus marinus]
MRILTHNFMQCPRSKSYPMRLVPTEVETVETEYSGEFIEHMLKRLNWDVLRSTASELELGELPETMPESEESNPEAFKLLHKILMETHVKSGTLVSGDGSTTYQINNYIANMMTTSTDPSTSNEQQKESEDVDME